MSTKIRFNNYSMLVERKPDYDWYDWCVFVDEDLQIVNNISSVQYTLHPTFPDPIKKVENNDNCFALIGSGWGGFRIKIKVNMKDGAIVNSEHFLILAKASWPKKEKPNSFEDEETESVYSALFHKKHRWRQVITVSKLTNLSERKVLKILKNLEEDDLVRKAHYKTIHGVDLWGATAVVGILPKP